MAKSATSETLADLIARLRGQRQKHLNSIAAIDKTFEQHGIASEPRRRRRRGRSKAATGKKKGKKVGKRKTTKKKAIKRRSFSKTADEFILGLLKGGKTLTTAAINGRWKQARRGGTADNTLSKLTKDGMLKKEQIEGARGSRYSLA